MDTDARGASRVERTRQARVTDSSRRMARAAALGMPDRGWRETDRELRALIEKIESWPGPPVVRAAREEAEGPARW